MKYVIPFFALIALLAICRCKNPCKGYVSYDQIDPRLRDYFFQVGSYWVYQDSASGDLDSQLVFKVVDKYVQTNPCQQISNPPSVTPPSLPTHDEVCCGPYNYDLLTMSVVAFRNNKRDSLEFTAGKGRIGLESNNQSILNNDLLFNLSPGTPPGPDAEYRLYYLGKINALSQNGVNYSDVAVFQTRYNAQYTYYFTCTTDLYFCLGYGIIKKVEHSASGDIVWKLTRFNLQ